MPVVVEPFRSQDIWTDIDVHRLLLEIRPRDVVEQLCHLGFISNEEIYRLNNLPIEHVLYAVNLKEFLQAVFRAKYHDIALKLLSVFRENALIFFDRVTATGPGFEKAQDIYFKMKVCTQNNTFFDPITTHFNNYKQKKRVFDELHNKFLAEQNEDVKEELKKKMTRTANICLAYLFVVLDAEITKWNKNFRWDEFGNEVPFSECPLQKLFHEAEFFLSEIPNRTVGEVGFFSRIAIAYAMTNQLTKAEEYIEAAFVSSIYIPRCAERYFMFHMHIMILLFKYQNDPNMLLSDRLCDLVDICIRSMQDEPDDLRRHFWMRMFLMRKVACFLGLNNEMKIIARSQCTQHDVNRAEDLLYVISRMGKMEKRREMFFYMAKARIAEIRSEFRVAIDFTQSAIDCDELKNYGETENVQRYQNLLRQNILA